MSETEKKQRSTKEIQAEYANACLKAGNLQYEVLAKQNDLKLINDRLRDLNFEFIASKNAEDAAAATPPPPALEAVPSA